MSIEFGLWIVPVAITIIGAIPVMAHKHHGDYDFGGAIIAALWFFASIAAWAVWGLSWLF